MSDLKLKVAIALVCIISVAFIASASATDYNPGVSANQYIKYGNVMMSGPTVPADANDTDYIRIDVVDISGTNVTLHMSGQYKNGTAATPESGYIVDVETGYMNYSSGLGSFVIAANLQEGDNLTTAALSLKVNTTETRTYLSANRAVNIVNLTYSGYMIFLAYDQASGILLELDMIPMLNTEISFSVVETNIFTTGPAAWLQDNLIYIVIVIIVIIVVVAAVVLMRRKKPPETPPAETKTGT